MEAEMKIIATVTGRGFDKFHYEFDHTNVKRVYRFFQKNLGDNYKNTCTNNKPVWNFKRGKVVLEGDIGVKFGYRTIK
jgi:hypothetical protein